MKTSLLEGEFQVYFNVNVKGATRVIPVKVDKNLLKNPPEDIKIKVRVQSTNDQLFELV
jgi:hypothetical protein